jgi:hypothetical protein
MLCRPDGIIGSIGEVPLTCDRAVIVIDASTRTGSCVRESTHDCGVVVAQFVTHPAQAGADDKLSQIDRRSHRTTHLGMPSTIRKS